MFEFRELYRAYLNCRRNKRNSESALRFEMAAEQYLFGLKEALVNHVYRPSPYACFVVRDPKLREIFAAPFVDRVVHHLLVNRLEPSWERRFIHDSWAGRCGKGLHAAVDRLQGFARQVSGNGRNRAWYLKLDIRSLYMSIDRRILYQRLQPEIFDPDTDWLVRILLTHDPTKNVLLRSPRWLIDQVPSHKSLFHVPSGKGLPIGNLTSQFFANVYLDALDQFIKHQLRCHHYLRYMDDMVFLHPVREQLTNWQAEIETFLWERLALVLNHSQTRLRPVNDGIDFLGYIVRPRVRLVRRA